MEKTTLFSGTASRGLAADIAGKLGKKLGKIEIGRFSDGEIDVCVEERVSGQEVVVIQSTNPPVNDNLVELCLVADALRRSYAKRITAVIPYFGYARKDKLSRAGEPLSGKVATDFLVSSGVNRIICVDLHSKPIVGFANIPVIELSAIELFAKALLFEESSTRTIRDSSHSALLRSNNKKAKGSVPNPVIFAPDAGGVKRARDLGQLLDLPVGFVEKDRSVCERDRTEVLTCNGAVRNHDVILIDDIVSTGGTLMSAAGFLKKQGAKKITVCVTHAIFSEESQIKLQNSDIDQFFITNSTNVSISPGFKKLKVLNLASLLAAALK